MLHVFLEKRRMKDTTVSFKRQLPLWRVCRIYLEEKRSKLKKRGRRCQRELDGGEERKRKVSGWRRVSWGLRPRAVRGLRSPQWFWLWSKCRPCRASPALGHTNPRPAHILPLFSCLQIASGCLSWWDVLFSFFFSLFTHKMCIRRTKQV